MIDFAPSNNMHQEPQRHGHSSLALGTVGEQDEHDVTHIKWEADSRTKEKLWKTYFTRKVIITSKILRSVYICKYNQ